MLFGLLKIFLPMIVTLLLGLFITPFATHFFYKYKLWKKKIRTEDTTSPQFKLVHQEREKEEISVPCVGGIIIWFSVFLSTALFFLLSILIPTNFFVRLNFFSRSQTFLPLGILFLGSVLGLMDDILEIAGKSYITRESAWYTRAKILVVAACGLIAGSWFFYKLGLHAIHLPFGGSLELGIFFVPVVILVMLSTFSGGVIDGLDGLSGGVLASIFGAYSVIAFTNNQIDLAVFCAVVTGAILAFLWFNIPPARFYMGETGMMGLTITLATLAFLTDSVLILPIIAMPLLISSLSVILQVGSKKLRRGKKVFLLAPIHHHFEALGWPAYKVTMRFWILAVAFSIIGVILAIISR